ncbi:MAG: hypothetical protein F4138_00145 [Acidimicrobiia bacterium]|nr:hypothetical protein [Acidimicrobiia bacterium]MYC57896.1 hypothetical protein [Acidimicrobiia bacterium]MYG93397.1 hypothetical protein [Acidimicrobiia bacterium]MYI29796.1 hypothetical protein [Acidimicrobiia bacterium]
MANQSDLRAGDVQDQAQEHDPVVVDAAVSLMPINGEARPISDWVTVFHLVMVVLDPYTHESSWILNTSGRVLRNFAGADCRVAYLVTGTPGEAKSFLGPWAEEILTFADEDRYVVKALGLQSLPAIVHLDHQLNLRTQAQGWNPKEWRNFANQLSRAMSWHTPLIPAAEDPSPFNGTPALG